MCNSQESTVRPAEWTSTCVCISPCINSCRALLLLLHDNQAPTSPTANEPTAKWQQHRPTLQHELQNTVYCSSTPARTHNRLQARSYELALPYETMLRCGWRRPLNDVRGFSVEPGADLLLPQTCPVPSPSPINASSSQSLAWSASCAVPPGPELRTYINRVTT